MADGRTAAPAAAGSRITHRTFLRLLAGALGGIGLGALAGRPDRARALPAPGPMADGVDWSVGGNLLVGQRAGLGAVVPEAPISLDVAGAIRVNGVEAIGADRCARQCYFAGTGGTPWSTVATWTWGALAQAEKTWGQVENL